MTTNRVLSDASNHGPLANVINWILLVVMCLAAITKVFTKWILIRGLQYDDAFAILGMLFATGYGIAVTIQVSAGLGRHESTLTDYQISRYQKAIYCSEIMYIMSLAFSKQAVLQLFATLARNSPRIRAIYAISWANALFAITILVSIAFQCPPPNSWEVLSPKCFDQEAFWKSFATLDIAIDASTAVLAGYVFFDLSMPTKIKIPIIIAFSSRAFLVPLIITRLTYVLHALHSHDHSYEGFLPMILTSICVNGSVIITCIPFLKPVLKGIQSGILAGDVRSLAPLETSTYLFSAARKDTNSHDLKNSRNSFKLGKLKERGDSQDRIITETHDVCVETSVSESKFEGWA